jgi:three-Cys-motif partner protein
MMAKDQTGFWKQKKPWSKVKDDLLGHYLRAYFQKILTTQRPTLYIDCFAGKGEFEDGTPGSPLIALAAALQSVRHARTSNQGIRMAFVEAARGDELASVLDARDQVWRSRIPYTVVKSRFEWEARSLVSGAIGNNVFLYIDPFGIKDLDHGIIASLGSRELRLDSIELLMNLNSFGFVRAACRAMKVKYQHDGALAEDDSELIDPLESSGDNKAVDLLDAVAGGDYWQPVIDAYRSGGIDGYEAERRFSEAYRRKLMETYRYVLSMPIRLAGRGHPKYRMVHATNHPAGCVLMAENMMKRTDDLYIHLPGHAQGSLFDQDVEGELTDPAEVRQRVRDAVASLQEFTDANEAMAEFYTLNGVICKPDSIRDAWRELELSGRIEVKRNPPQTETGKLSTFFTPSKGKTVRIRARHP